MQAIIDRELRPEIMMAAERAITAAKSRSRPDASRGSL